MAHSGLRHSPMPKADRGRSALPLSRMFVTSKMQKSLNSSHAVGVRRLITARNRSPF